MENVVAAVLVEDEAMIVFFEKAEDAHALIAGADESHYGSTWEVFEGTVEEFQKRYDFDPTTASPLTSDAVQKFKDEGQNIWAVTEDEEQYDASVVSGITVKYDNE